MRFFDLFRKALPAGTTSFILQGENSGINRDIRAFAREGYAENPIVYACTNIIATAAASVKLEIHTTDKDGNRKVENAHPILKLMANPNPTQTWEEFAKELVTWYGVAGECFILRLPKTGTPKELYLLNPDHVEVKGSTTSAIPLEYVYGSGENRKVFPVNQFDGTSQVLHIKTFNPETPWRGLSPLRPAARAVDTHNNGSRWNSSLLMNSARPTGVIEVAGTVSETTITQIRDYFKKALSGAANAGNAPVLTGGAKWVQMSHAPKDMDFQNSMGEAAKNTGLVYGVPLPLLTMEASTFSNMAAAQERLWEETVLPLLNLVVRKLGMFLVPLFPAASKQAVADGAVQLAYNADSVPALEPKRERLYKRMKEAVGGCLITPNEARAEMGFAEMEGGDKLLKPGTLQPIDAVETQPATELVKAMKACGFTAAEIVEAVGPDYLKAA